MRFNFAIAATASLAILPNASALRILLANDDGWAEANVREFYRLLTKSGHDVILAGPVVDNSGQGGRAVFTDSGKLYGNGQYGTINAGAPSVGSDPNNDRLNYYNGTPAAVTFVGLDYIVPRRWGKNAKPDLFVSGPNVGTNLGPFLFTLSGTMGSTYAAVGRGIPGIAFSGGSLYGHRSYKEINSTTKTGKPDPATLYAQRSVDLVNQLVKNKRKGERLLPLGYGINVNYAAITSLTNTSCIKPEFYQTRLTTGAFSDYAAYNQTTGVFTYQNILGEGFVCINGECRLPGETDVVNSGCNAAVSVFTVDYDAPRTKDTDDVQKSLQPLVKPYGKGKGGYKRFAAPGPEEAPRRHE